MASISDLQRNYKSLVECVKETRTPLFVLKRNKVEVVLLDKETFKEMARQKRMYEEEQALKAIKIYKREKAKDKLKKMRSTKELFAE